MRQARSLVDSKAFSVFRCGKLEFQEESFVRVGMESAQEDDPSVTLAREDFA